MGILSDARNCPKTTCTGLENAPSFGCRKGCSTLTNMSGGSGMAELWRVKEKCWGLWGGSSLGGCRLEAEGEVALQKGS